MDYCRIIIAGRLTRDPEIRHTDSGTSVANFGIACDTGWGENRKPMFLDCDAWGKSAEAIAKHFHKGKAILIDGELRLDVYTNNEGVEVRKHKMTVDTWRFTDEPRREEQPATVPTYETGPAPPVAEEDVPF